jgi:uncharacterized integral membrane protein
MAGPSQETPTKRKFGRRGVLGGKGRSNSEIARSVVLVVLAVLITLFAVLNLKEVKVDWIFGSGHAPLIIVIVVSLLVGIVLTYSAERIVRKRR